MNETRLTSPTDREVCCVCDEQEGGAGAIDGGGIEACEEVSLFIFCNCNCFIDFPTPHTHVFLVFCLHTRKYPSPLYDLPPKHLVTPSFAELVVSQFRTTVLNHLPEAQQALDDDLATMPSMSAYILPHLQLYRFYQA